MTVSTLRSGSSSWVNSTHPSTEYGATNPDRITIKGTTAFGFVKFPFGTELRPGVVILSATLQLTQDAAGTYPVVAQRAAPWRPRTLNWGNQPGVTGAAVAATRSGTLLSFAVGPDVQAMVDTAGNNGWRISTTDATTNRRLFGFPATVGDPVLVIDYTYPPAAPTDLRPASGAVSVTKPELVWTAGASTAFQVQIDPTGVFTSPTFDSGTVVSTASSYNLSASTYGGITSGSTQWRVRVRNAAGVWSPWSSPAVFPYSAKPAAALSQPGVTVWESTPPLKLDMPGLVRARFFVYATANPGVVLYDSGELVTTTGEHTPPRPVFVKDGASYTVEAWGWDAVVRSATPGDPPYVVVKATTTLAFDPGTTGVAWTTAEKVGTTPTVDVRVSRQNPPDSFTLLRNGQPVATGLNPFDLRLPGTTTYSCRDHTAAPFVANTYRLAPVVNNKTATDGVGQSATITPRIAGIWLLDPANGIEFQMFGTDEGDWTRPEIHVLHTLEDGSVVKRHFGYGDHQGSVSGTLANALGQTADEMVRRFETLRANPSGVYRLVKVGLNIPVVLLEPQVTPRRRGSAPGKVLYDVHFGFQQQRARSG